MAERVHHEPDPVAHAELLEDARQVGADGALADCELLGNLLVLLAGGNETDDLELAVGDPQRIKPAR